MANEFVIENGYISNGDGTINSNLNVSGNLTVGGLFSANTVTITNLNKLSTISADTFYITTTPTSNASATQILSRNTSTGVIEYRDSSTFGGSTNIFSNLSADTITLTTTPTSNASATQILTRNSTTGVVEYRDYSTFTGGGGGTLSGDTYVTGFTYSNNNLTISRNQGQPNLTVNISTMTGLTVNGSLSASTMYITTTPTLDNTNTQILTRNVDGSIDYSDNSSTAIYNYGVSFAMGTSNFLT